MVEVKVPAFTEVLTEGKLTAWLANNGAWVVKGQAVATLETDKAVFELLAEADGRIWHAARVGQTFAVGSVIATIG